MKNQNFKDNCANLRKPLRIYLADLVHNFIRSRDNWMIPLSAMLIASYTKAEYGDRVEIQLFKFPDQLLRAIKEMPPDIIGLSNYCWNFELNKTLLKFTKKHNPETITVMGGPNVTLTQSRITQFLKETHCDYYVIGAGEHPFKCLVGSMLKSEHNVKELHKSSEVHGVWYLDPITKEAVTKPVKQIIKDLDEIPSPFQSGIADEFLKLGLIPMIETQRGCPFRCTFCSWDNAANRVYTYSVGRIVADVDYCRRHAADERILINDANFGLLGKRDMEIAKFIRHLHDKYGWPGKVIANWGQARKDVTLQIAGILKDICILRQSAQSLNPVVLKNIKRKNISDEQWKKFSIFCKEHGINSFSELLIPLPGETMETYLAALRYLFDLDIDCINTNTLMLCEGALINKSEERQKYGMRTAWRLMENCYGIYEDHSVVEYQEILIKTNTFSTDDFFLCRPLSWLIQMSWTLCHYDLLLRLVRSFGVNPIDFLLKAICDYKKGPLSVRNLFENFFEEAQKEFFSNKEELISFYSTLEKMEFLRNGGFRKLNSYYSGRVLFECNKDFVDYYENLACELVKEYSIMKVNCDEMIRDCSRFVQQRYIKIEELAELEVGRNINKKETFRYDILRWSQNTTKKNLWEYHCPNDVTYEFFIDVEQIEVIRQHLQRFSGMSREYQFRKLQEPFQGIDRKHLLFQVK